MTYNEPIARALIGTSEAIEAEFSAVTFDNAPFVFAEMVDDEVIAVSGYQTLEDAARSAINYGFELKQLEIYGMRPGFKLHMKG